MTNGIAISLDGSRIYVGCYDESAIVKNNDLLSGMFIARYKIDNNGQLSFDKKFIQYDLPVGPDGIDTDKDGNLYVAVRDENYPHIAVHCAHSKLLTKISLKEVPSNVCFGKGIYNNILYITAGKSLYKINLQ
jgi:gluconolactonase